jgi:hypothetical protein
MYPARSTAISIAAGVVIVLNLLDAMFTIVYLQTGLATEANPLMDGVMSASPVLFMAAKLALVSLGVHLLWRFRNHRSARFGLFATSAAYTMLIGYHLSAVDQLARVVG